MSAAAYADYVLSLAPTAYWKCDETTGTNIADSSPSGVDGTLSGTLTSYTTSIGQFDSILDFDGSTNVVDIASIADTQAASSYVANSGIWSICWWAAWDQYNLDALGAMIGNSIGSAENGWSIWWDDRTAQTRQNSITFWATPTSHNFADDVIPDANFHFYAMTGDQTNIRFYVDASLVGTVSLSMKNIGFADAMSFGKIEHSGTNYWWDGKLGQISIHPRTLGTTELTRLYNLGTNAYTVSGTLTHGGSGVANKVVAYDPVDGRICGVTTAAANGTFTMDVSTTNAVYIFEYPATYGTGDPRPRIHGPISVT